MTNRVTNPDEDVVPAGATPSPEPTFVSGGARRRLMTSMLVSNLLLFATYAGVVAILLPQQISNLDSAAKVTNLAIVTSISAFATLFIQPIVGALSDRTRARLGRRSPWIVFGGIGGGLCTIALQFAPSVFWITVTWVAAQVLLNALQGPTSAIIADRVATDHRGTASAFTGVGMGVGAAAGVTFAGQWLSHLGVAYTTFGVAMIVLAVAFVLLNPDRSSTDTALVPFDWAAFAKGFWVSPRKHPDFAWAFGGRFFMVLGYQAITAYSFYILTDYIHVPLAEAGTIAGVTSLCGAATMVVGTLIFGRISDATGRRKVFVFTASVIMALGIAVPLVAPSVTAMIVYSLVVGLGYGAYIAVDLALMIDVLPSSGDSGRDLGVLNVASNIPQTLTPLAAAILLGLFANNYASLFVYGIVAVLVSSLLVFPIKSVR